MIRVYTGEPEECTEKDLNLFSHQLKQIGIKMAVIHMEICLSTNLEISTKEMDLLEKEYPTKINQPLQPNSIYSFTSIEDKSIDERKYPVIAILRRKSRLKHPAIVKITTAIPQESELKALNIANVVKDITFLNDTDGKEIGWYNINTNIIWFSDIFHYRESVKKVFPEILSAIIDIKTIGRISQVLTVGADPEFEIIDSDNNIVPANSVFQTNGEIGWDDHPTTGELRPKPDNSPLGLARNIKRLIRRMRGMQILNDTKLYAGGGTKVTTGGHLHFGSKAISKELKYILHDLVAGPVLAYQSQYRTKNQPATIDRDGSDVIRTDKAHGFEWRPLPSFIINEDLTTAVICTAYAVVKSIKFHNWSPKITPTAKLTIAKYQEIPLYPIYKEWIDKFYEFFVEGTCGKLQERDMFKEWKLSKITREFTVEIISNVDWIAKFFKPLNIKLAKSVKLSIHFDDDPALVTYGIPKKYLTELQIFTRKHFMQMRCNEKPATKHYAKSILLPYAWKDMEDTSGFCKELKDVIKKIVINLGNN